MKAVRFVASLLRAVGRMLQAVPDVPASHHARRCAVPDHDAFARLVAACGHNPALAEELIEHECRSNGRSCRYHAILAAIGRIRDYRRYGRLLNP
ncbi:hypothetical protein [Vogesella sp. LIG4]|uniref:hypothetical protein n=1 Tax=Vogesella sp. LIG4 TaxID=1192162 RepID=UPI0012FD3A87|nr:hypothetical protein [Vogesella sp. LIG4]